MSDITVYAITGHNVIAYTNWRMPQTIDTSLLFLDLSDSCEHFALIACIVQSVQHCMPEEGPKHCEVVCT